MTNSSIQWNGLPKIVGGFMLKKGTVRTADNELEWVVGLVSQQNGKKAVATFSNPRSATSYFNQLRETLGD